MNIYNVDNVSCLTDGCIATVGTFDGLHRGHQHILEELVRHARQQYLVPLVVTFDAHPRIVLGSAGSDFRLLSASLYDRLETFRVYGIQHLLLIHFTPQVAALPACGFLQKCICDNVNLKALLLGYDNVFGNKHCNDFDQIDTFAHDHGIHIYRDEAVLHQGIDISSTQVRKALVAGDVSLASAMLGHPFRLRGVVVHGCQLGRSIHFPTANIAINNPYQALPADGVYAVNVTLNGTQYHGMANLGQRPTVGDAQRTLEVHLLQYQGDLYGQSLTVEFVHFLRPISCFHSVNALAEQLKCDLRQTQSLFSL